MNIYKDLLYAGCKGGDFLESSQSSGRTVKALELQVRQQPGKSWGQWGWGWGGPLGWEEKDLGEGAAAAQDGSWASLEVLPRGVSQAVPPQITVSPEHFAAPLAAVGLDVCMGEKVSFQITSLIKGSSTCGAFVWRFLFRCEARQRINPSHHHGHPPQQFLSPQHQALT